MSTPLENLSYMLWHHEDARTGVPESEITGAQSPLPPSLPTQIAPSLSCGIEETLGRLQTCASAPLNMDGLSNRRSQSPTERARSFFWLAFQQASNRALCRAHHRWPKSYARCKFVSSSSKRQRRLAGPGLYVAIFKIRSNPDCMSRGTSD